MYVFRVYLGINGNPPVAILKLIIVISVMTNAATIAFEKIKVSFRAFIWIQVSLFSCLFNTFRNDSDNCTDNDCNDDWESDNYFYNHDNYHENDDHNNDDNDDRDGTKWPVWGRSISWGKKLLQGNNYSVLLIVLMSKSVLTFFRTTLKTGNLQAAILILMRVYLLLTNAPTLAFDTMSARYVNSVPMFAQWLENILGENRENCVR